MGALVGVQQTMQTNVTIEINTEILVRLFLVESIRESTVVQSKYSSTVEPP